MILGRLYLIKYLNSKKPEDYQIAYKQLTQEVEKEIKNIQAITLTPNQKNELSEFDSIRSEYIETVEIIYKTIESEQNLVKNKLEQLGNRIA
ncbi:hypothetical protein ABMA58_15585, partial [Oceanospirillum sp. HFRX-1_2]